MKIFWLILSCACWVPLWGAEAERWVRDVSYREGEVVDAYARERCKLDICSPLEGTKHPVVVWFHGGGLTRGEKSLPEGLRERDIVLVSPNYRLAPKVDVDTCIDDAAAAVAWTFQHIDEYGGDPKKIVISGHSAGGYLSSMVGLDEKRLAKHGADAGDLLGLAPFSGHTITHFTARKEQGLAATQPRIDEQAPLFHIRKDAPPMVLLTGDRDLEMLGRYEENAYFWRMMRELKHPDCALHELKDRDHGSMVEAGCPLLLSFVARLCREQADR